MTQEEKQLLLKDLCARLPYGVYAKLPNHKLVEHTYFLESINMRNGWTEGVLECAGRKQIYSAEVEDVKPYLSPMSSMTAEDIQGMFNSYYFKCNSQGIMLPCRGISELLIEYHKCYMPIDWLNKHHFDYRGLIEKGLALKASEGMYNLNEI